MFKSKRHNLIIMSERQQQRMLEKLEEISAQEPVKIMFRNGDIKTGHVYDVNQDSRGYCLIYSVGGLPDVEGSKVDPRDWLPSVPLSELGYVQVQSTGRKVSLMPFQRKVS